MRDNRCIICGKNYNPGSVPNISEALEPLVDKNDCYRIYKKLLSVYGTAYIDLLNSI